MRHGELRAVRIAVKTLLVLGLLVWLAASCRSPAPAERPPPAVYNTTPADTAPTCAAVGTHLHDARAALIAKLSDTDTIAEDAEVFTDECVRGNFSPVRRNCLLGATTPHDQDLCERDARIAAGEDLGGMSCGEYVTRWMATHLDKADDSEMYRYMIERQCLQLTRFEKECLSAAPNAEEEVTCWEESKKRR